MNKIQQRLNNHPRLKKCLKLLAVVGMCLSVLFNALILGVVIADKVGNGAKSKSIANAVTTPIKSQFNVNQYDFYTFSDLASANAYLNYNSYVTNEESVDLNTIQSDTTYTYQLNNYLSLVHGYDLTLSNIYSSDNLVANFTRVTFTAKPRVQVRSSPTRNYYQQFIIKFFTSTSGESYEIWYRYIENNSLNASRTWFTTGIYHIENGSDVSDYGSDLLFVCQYQLLSWGRDFLPYYVGGQTGYENGYNVGYSAGYSNGYTLGYQSGIESGGIDYTNPFTLISTAFDSVASVLNINILPNLSLGVLLFIPLIVTIVIVVVKMVKG